MKIQKVIEMKSWFFVKINKIKKPLAKLTGRKKNKLLKVEVRKEALQYIEEIKRIIRTFLKDKLRLTKRCK